VSNSHTKSLDFPRVSRSFFNGRRCNPSNLIFVKQHFYDFPTVLLSNITGALSNKLPEISEISKLNDTNIICLTESWCNTDIPDDAIGISNYSFYRRDRQDGRAGGGLICYINENIPVVKLWSELNEIDLETLFITIRPKRLPRGISSITVGVVYHPPKCDDWNMTTHLINCVDKIRQQYPHTRFIICGDFNHMKDSFFKQTCQFQQIVKHPTHGNSKIDLFYTDLTDYYNEPVHEPGIGLSKHQTIIIKSNNRCVEKPKIVFVEKRKQTKQNKSNLILELSQVSWVDLFKTDSCKQKFEIFMDVINRKMNEHLPVVKTQVNNNDMPWVTDRFRYFIKRRQFHFKSGNDTLYRFYRNKVNRERKRLKQQFVNTTLSTLKGKSSKNWWDLIKSITGKNTKVNHLQRLANSLFDGDIQKLSNEINLSFQNVSSHLAPLHSCHATDFIVPNEYIISVEEVEKQLSKINIKKSPGPDGIPSWLLKEACHELAAPICAIWNASLSQSYIPFEWKSANTCPLPKVSHPVSFEKDLRPISLTPILSKGLEYHTRNWLMNIFKPHIDDYQYGSLKECSTIFALAQLIHEWLLSSESKQPITRILLLDFKKAFDLVDHNIIVDKIAAIDTPPFLSNWLKSFLSDRKQRVKIGSTTSSWANLNAGVPQGTLLGPILFLLHINDLNTVCPSVKYVDDTTIWESCTHNIGNSKIQISANQVTDWCQKNNMQINCDKTKEMIIYFGKKEINLPNITMNGKHLERVDNTKLLGIVINNKLTWDDHVNYMCTKVSKRIYFIRLLKRAGVMPNDILLVYFSIIRSVLEYGSEIWHPGLNKMQTRKLEYIQKRVVKIIFPDLPYYEAIKKHDIPLLEDRREEICKRFFLSISKPENKLHKFLPTKCNISHLRSNRKFNLPKVKTDRLKHSPIFYGVFNFQ
jgi:hypothetical protein